MRILAKSDIGKARDMNQDNFYAAQETDKIKLFILADGMGGYKGGEIASSVAVYSAQNYICNNFEEIAKDKETILKLITDSIEYANLMVYERSKETEELKDMGTTLDVCLIYNNKAFIGHVGDSRIYRIRKNFMRRLTKDHSYVEQLVEDGKITKEEADTHPKKNMLVKAIGCNSLVEPDVTCKAFLQDDILLMCSDGLTNMLKDQEIYKVLLENSENPVAALINRANREGGMDNITAIIIDNIEKEPEKAPQNEEIEK